MIDRSKLPHKPGIYQFLNSKADVLYVGKAIDLYHRVASYFSKDIQGKTAALVKEIASVKTIIVESELEALILEANLIKKYRPPFNIRLRDDKDYLYIALTKDEFPKVTTVRKKDLKKIKKYWGPFPSSKTVRNTLKQIRRVFPWCSGERGSYFRRACFYFHIGLCPGACVGLAPKAEYNKIVKRFTKFLDGKKQELIQDLTAEMMEASKEQNFEEAARLKETVDGINYLTQTNRTSLYLENPNFLEEETKLALEKIKKDLNLPGLPVRIEGYDISNIQGKQAVGSMVVLTNGEIDKSQYRKFKIHISGQPNDVGMLREMIKRRLKHSEWPLPDLIIVDGGRGQTRAANLALGAWRLEIPVYGLAKRMEWLYPPQGEVIKLPKISLSLRLLQKLRDESHRFAIAYHRKLHGRMVLGVPKL